MIYEVYNNNGTKDIRPIAGSIPGQGNPVGTILPYWGSNIPDKYLLCDGSTFDADEYPALYMHLGTNVLPDLRGGTIVSVSVNYIIKATASMDTDDAQSVFQNIKNYIEGDVLWEIDPSSISTQDAQSYTLDTVKSFADYKYIDVYVTQAPVVTLDLDDPKGVKYNHGVDVYTSHFFTTYPNATNGSRNFKVLSDTTFQVYDCYIGTSTYNNDAIIYKVVGKNHK